MSLGRCRLTPSFDQASSLTERDGQKGQTRRTSASRGLTDHSYGGLTLGTYKLDLREVW